MSNIALEELVRRRSGSQAGELEECGDSIAGESGPGQDSLVVAVQQRRASIISVNKDHLEVINSCSAGACVLTCLSVPRSAQATTDLEVCALQTHITCCR